MDDSECGVPDNRNGIMKYQIDFMTEEYKQMFNSWFNLKKEKADYIKTYITLVTLPPAIIVRARSWNYRRKPRLSSFSRSTQHPSPLSTL